MLTALFVFIAVFLVCFGMGVAMGVYLCILWSTIIMAGSAEQVGMPARKGLSSEDLEKLGGETDGGREGVRGVPGRHRGGAAGAGAARLRPRLPPPLRRPVAVAELGLPPLPGRPLPSYSSSSHSTTTSSCSPFRLRAAFVCRASGGRLIVARVHHSRASAVIFLY